MVCGTQRWYPRAVVALNLREYVKQGAWWLTSTPMTPGYIHMHWDNSQDFRGIGKRGCDAGSYCGRPR
jgi:hypothetical protein